MRLQVEYKVILSAFYLLLCVHIFLPASSSALAVAHSYAVQTSGAPEFALVRYNANGSLDTAFGASGIVTNNAADASLDGTFNSSGSLFLRLARTQP